MALIPLILCLLLWVIPGSANSAAKLPLDPGPSAADSTAVDELVSPSPWKPGSELLAVGFFTAVAIYLLLRVQDRLQDRARQRW
ncbi:MAG: hypothetical protein VX764_02120 [Planctomycetota bacterium]|nr:hypothetical protein [Planctomycetota bacterium]